MSKYNGHRNYEAWNVSLWLNNNDFFYTKMQSLISFNNRKVAARKMLDFLIEGGIPKTGDGVLYTVTNIELAMRGM
jgi:hypothetical protein